MALTCGRATSRSATSRRCRWRGHPGWCCGRSPTSTCIPSAWFADYIWTVFVDAAEHLGGRAVGTVALAATASTGEGVQRVTCSGSATWRRTPDLKDRYDVIIIGGVGTASSLAYYLARDHGINDVCVLEQGYIGSGAAGA